MTDDVMDKEDADFLSWMVRLFRSDVVNALLAGNDAQCFTTEQYQQMYDKRVTRPAFRKDHAEWHDGLAERHLRAMPDLVREVSPGVWAAATVEAGRT